MSRSPMVGVGVAAAVAVVGVLGLTFTTQRSEPPPQEAPAVETAVATLPALPSPTPVASLSPTPAPLPSPTPELSPAPSPAPVAASPAPAPSPTVTAASRTVSSTPVPADKAAPASKAPAATPAPTPAPATTPAPALEKEPAATPAPVAPAPRHPPERAQMLSYLDRVLAHLPDASATDYTFASWKHQNRPTSEGLGMLPHTGINPDRVIQRVMDVNHYVGNIDYVMECRSIKDERFQMPKDVLFYQRVKLPLLGHIQHQLVLEDLGTRRGYRVAGWYLMEKETADLDKSKGFRSQYSVGMWLASPNAVGYALSSAPRREDVSWTTWTALTTGADATASTVIKANIDGMIKWASR